MLSSLGFELFDQTTARRDNKATMATSNQPAADFERHHLYPSAFEGRQNLRYG